MRKKIKKGFTCSCFDLLHAGHILMLKDDETLTNEERMDLYYEEHLRVQKEREDKRLLRGAKPLDQVMKEIGIKPSNWKPKKK